MHLACPIHFTLVLPFDFDIYLLMFPASPISHSRDMICPHIPVLASSHPEMNTLLLFAHCTSVRIILL